MHDRSEFEVMGIVQKNIVNHALIYEHNRESSSL